MNDGYDQWKQQVEGIILSRVNVDVDDLPDYNWRDCFESGLTPHEAFAAFADDVLDEMGWEPDER